MKTDTDTFHPFLMGFVLGCGFGASCLLILIGL